MAQKQKEVLAEEDLHIAMPGVCRVQLVMAASIYQPIIGRLTTIVEHYLDRPLVARVRHADKTVFAFGSISSAKLRMVNHASIAPDESKLPLPTGYELEMAFRPGTTYPVDNTHGPLLDDEYLITVDDIVLDLSHSALATRPTSFEQLRAFAVGLEVKIPETVRTKYQLDSHAYQILRHVQRISDGQDGIITVARNKTTLRAIFIPLEDLQVQTVVCTDGEPTILPASSIFQLDL